MAEETVLHVQQRLFVDDEGDHPHHAAGTPGPNLIRSILFQPIAGGRPNDESSQTSSGALQGMQFGVLDAETIFRMASTIVTNPACVEQPGSLMDLRMGASAVSNIPCESCHENHHNCPPVVRP